MRIEKLRDIQTAFRQAIGTYIWMVRNHHAPPKSKLELDFLKILIANYSIAYEEVECLIRDLEMIETNCKELLKLEPTSPRGLVKWNHLQIFLGDINFVAEKNMIKEMWLAYRESLEGIYGSSRLEEEESDEEKAKSQDHIIISSIEDNFFFDKFYSDLNQASEIAKNEDEWNNTLLNKILLLICE